MLFSRREVLIGASAVAAEFALACSGADIIFPKEQPKNLEKRNTPRPGDYLQVRYTNGVRYFLMREGLYYPIEDIRFFLDATEILKYGGQGFAVNPDFLSNGKIGKLPDYPAYPSPFTSDLKNYDMKTSKRKGGKAIDLYSGFATSEEEETADFRAIDLTKDPTHGTFPLFIKEFREKRFIPADIHHFTYGRRDGSFSRRDTAKPLVESISDTLDYGQTNQDDAPLSQRNGEGHSLGARLLLEVAILHPDWFNNIILVNPVLWLTEEPPERVKRFFRIWDELARSYKDDRKRLEEGIEKIKRFGKKVTVIRDEDDPLVSKINASQEVILQSTGNRNILEAHGRPLKDERIAKFIAEVIGQKIAA